MSDHEDKSILPKERTWGPHKDAPGAHREKEHSPLEKAEEEVERRRPDPPPSPLQGEYPGVPGNIV